LDPIYISGTGKATDFKFGVRIDCHAYKRENAKVGQEGRALLYMT